MCLLLHTLSLKHPLQTRDQNKLQFPLFFRCQVKRVMGSVCWSGVWERGLLLAHLSKQLIRPEITHQEQHGRRAVVRAGVREQSNTQTRTGNKQTPPQTQWGDSGPCCSDCTAEQEEETSHQTRARKQSEGSFGSWAGGVEQRWEEGDSRRDKQRGEGMRGLRGSKTCLAFTFFLFLWVAVALIFDEARAGWASGAGHALQAALHQLAQLAARSWRHHLTVLALTSTHISC